MGWIIFFAGIFTTWVLVRILGNERQHQIEIQQATDAAEAAKSKSAEAPQPATPLKKAA